jgi:hypothetical protein
MQGGGPARIAAIRMSDVGQSVAQLLEACSPGSLNAEGSVWRGLPPAL